MGSLLGGILVAATALMLWMAPAANAVVQIPPTAECEATYKQLLRVYNDELPDDATRRQIAESERRFYNELADADCISSARPLIQDSPARPFTDECVKAAADAQAFWGPLTANINVLTRVFRKLEKRFKRRSKALARRVAHLKQVDRPRQAAAVNRKRQQLKRTYKSKVRKMNKKARPLFFGTAYKTLLVVTEFSARRCLSSDLLDGNRPNGPAWRVFVKNVELIIGQVFWVAFKYLDDSNSSSDSSSRSITRSLPPVNGSTPDADRSTLPEPLASLVD